MRAVGVVGLLRAVGMVRAAALALRRGDARAGLRRSIREFAFVAGDRRSGDSRGGRSADRGGRARDRRQRGVRRRPSAGAKRLRAAYARERGVDATSGHDVSSTYGLRARTRTAALNAAMLPRMVRTSRDDGRCRRARRDSGAADDHAQRRRRDGRARDRAPSDPHVAFGAGGRHRRRAASRKPHRRHLRRGRRDEFRLFGDPRRAPADAARHGSAVTARCCARSTCARSASAAAACCASARAGSPTSDRAARTSPAARTPVSPTRPARRRARRNVAPTPRDPTDYAVLVARDGTRIAPDRRPARPICLAPCRPARLRAGTRERARRRIRSARASDRRRRRSARAQRCSRSRPASCAPTLDELIADYELDRDATSSSSAAAAVRARSFRYAAAAHALPFRIARDAEVIAPIGVALALVRDVVERTIAAPTPADIARVRREATDRVVASGAAPDRVEVTVEIDPQRNRVRAIASGSTALVDAVAAPRATKPAGAAAARSLRADPAELERLELPPRWWRIAVRIRRSFGRVRDVRLPRRRTRRRAARVARCRVARHRGRRIEKRVRGPSSGRPASATSVARSRRFISCGARASRRSKDSPTPSKRSRWRRKNSRAATRASASRF